MGAERTVEVLAAGLVDRVHLTVFPAITGATGTDPILAGAADFDLDLLEHRTLDGRTIERPDRSGRRPQRDLAVG